MRIVSLATLVAVLCASSMTWAADIRARTEDGREVLLKDDGTWSFVKSTGAEKAAPSSVKDKEAKLAYEGKSKKFAVYLKPGDWTKAEKPSNPVAEVMFVHKDGDIYAMIVAERISVPLQTLKSVALANMKTVDKDAKVISEEPRKVNGADVLCVKSEVTAQGVPLTFYTYYYTGTEGSIQVVTWTGRNIFDESKPEMEKFLNGFVIQKK